MDHLLSYLLDNPQCLFPMADEETALFMMEAALANKLRWLCELCIPAAITKQVVDEILLMKPDTQRPSVNLLQVPAKNVSIAFGLNSMLFRKLWGLRDYFVFMSQKDCKKMHLEAEDTASAAMTFSQSFSDGQASEATQFPSVEELNMAKKSQPTTPASVANNPEAAMVQRFLASIPTKSSVISAAAQPAGAKGAASGKGGKGGKGKGGKAGGKGGGKHRKRKNVVVPGKTHDKVARRSG